MPAFKKTDVHRKKERQKFLSKKVGRAIADYGMIEDGDKVLVGVSGGKDSLALCKILWDRRAFVPIRYDLLALHVDLGYADPGQGAWKRFFEEQGIPFYIRRKTVVPQDGQAPTCFWCAWNRRRVLFEEAKKHGCNKIALGHHKDDIVETILMNLFFEGEISAMAPNQELFRGQLRIIRPLAYIEEREISRFTRLMGFPVVRCECPNAGRTQRAVVKKIVAQLQRTAPGVKSNIFRSLQRIKKDYLLSP